MTKEELQNHKGPVWVASLILLRVVKIPSVRGLDLSYGFIPWHNALYHISIAFPDELSAVEALQQEIENLGAPL